MTDYETIQRLALQHYQSQAQIAQLSNLLKGEKSVNNWAITCLCIVVFFIALFNFLSFASAAEPYLVAGFGKARLIEDQTDDLWHQTGFAHLTAERSNTWRVGLGLKLNRYLSAELDYRDLGQFNQQSLAVSDLGGPGSYNTRTRTCNGPCEPTSSAWQHGTTQGVGLSLVAAPDWEIAPLVRAGMFYHRSSFFSSQSYGSQPHTQTLAVFHSNAESSINESFNDNRLGVLLGVGVRLRYLEFEYVYYPKVAAGVSPYRDIATLTLSFRVDL